MVENQPSIFIHLKVQFFCPQLMLISSEITPFVNMTPKYVHVICIFCSVEVVPNNKAYQLKMDFTLQGIKVCPEKLVHCTL